MARMKVAVLCCVLSVAASAQELRWDGADAAEAAQEEARFDAHRAYHARLADGLAASGGARDLAFAALLRGMAMPQNDVPAGDAPSERMPVDAQALARLRAAAEAAGDDVIANQLLAAATGMDDAALRTAAARRWQAADPGNLMPLLYMDLPVEGLLQEARRATRADARMYATVRWMMTAMLRHPPTVQEQALLVGDDGFHAEEHAAVSSMALWAATMAPGHASLMQACRGEPLRAVPMRRADCGHVASLLAGPSASVADQGVGLAMLRELAGSDAERNAADARMRRLHWQLIGWGRASMAQSRDGAAQFVRLLRDDGITSEQQLVERVLQEAGIPLDPPAGWVPPRG